MKFKIGVILLLALTLCKIKTSKIGPCSPELESLINKDVGL